jgi:8-oxo-dGTP diphosphatase
VSRWSPDPVHVAVDLTLFTVAEQTLRVLLHRRQYEPDAGRWALPGSFTRPGESLDETARRALQDKAGFEDVWLEQLATYDQATEAGATRVVSVVQLALVDAASATPAGEADWWPVGDLPGPLAFGHQRFVADGVARLRAKTRYAPVAFQLLGDAFTLADLRVVHEAVLGDELDVRNFRRDVLGSGTVEETGDVRREGPGRPAKLYRHTAGHFAVDAGERRTARLIAGGDEDREASGG